MVAVRDEGPGIAPEDRERIFERFYRMADHEAITGTGLGLPIARDLARAMGGELDAASLPGVGSSFVLVMPGPAGAIPAAAMAAATQAALAHETDRLRTLALLRAGAAARDADRGRHDRHGADERRRDRPRPRTMTRPPDRPARPAAGGHPPLGRLIHEPRPARRGSWINPVDGPRARTVRSLPALGRTRG